MQLSLFQEHHQPDYPALEQALQSGKVALDIETDTRWGGTGPRVDFGLSYVAPITVIGVAWEEGGAIQSVALAAPFDEGVLAWLDRLFRSDALIIAHNAVFDLRGLSKLTDGRIPPHIWDTMSMARLLAPAVDVSYSLLAVAARLGISIPQQQAAMKGQRAKLHQLPLSTVLEYAQDDAKVTYAIYQRQAALPADPELVEYECRALYEYCVMAARGMRLNAAYVETYLDELRDQRAVVIERLRQDGLTAPRNSRARAEYLYTTKGIPMPRWPQDRRSFTWAGLSRSQFVSWAGT